MRQLQDEFPVSYLPRAQPGPAMALDPGTQPRVAQPFPQPAQRLPVSARQNARGDQVSIFLPAQGREVIIPEQRPQPGRQAATSGRWSPPREHAALSWLIRQKKDLTESRSLGYTELEP